MKWWSAKSAPIWCIVISRGSAAVKVPDAKTMGRWGLALGTGRIEKIHERVVAIAQEKKVVEGRKMRVDTTVVETNIHYPTDSSLLGDGVRVLTRAMKRIAEIAGEQGAKLRDRSRSVKSAHSGDRARGAHQGRTEPGAIAAGIRKAAGVDWDEWWDRRSDFPARLRTGVKTIRGRDAASRPGRTAQRAGHHGAAGAAGDAASSSSGSSAATRMFPRSWSASSSRPRKSFARARRASPPSSARWSRSRKARIRSSPTMWCIEKRPSDSDLLIAAIESHEEQLGRVPRLVAGDAAFYSAANEAAAHEKGVKRVCIPNRQHKER